MSVKAKPKVGIVSLGCPRNLVDSETIVGRLFAKGFPVVGLDKADIGIVNTCAFIKDAKAESIDAILDLVELKKQGALKKVVVYGCLAQRYKEELKKELPEVDAFVGRVSLNHERRRFRLTPSHYAYLKICEGCFNACSYCAIPAIKGKFTSLPAAEVLDKVKALDGEGVRELNIIGQDISAYGMERRRKEGLSRLLRGIIPRARHIGWVRLLYLYPTRITDELLEIIKDEPKVCKYVDVPLQHISTRILKLMRREISRKETVALIDRIRKKVPGVALRTSFIVGFPSETEREFRELCSFVRDARFERMGAFAYSREEGTPAFRLQPQVPEALKKERLERLMLLQQEISASVNRGLLGREMTVLIDEEERNGHYLGRTQQDAPEVDGTVYVRSARRLKEGDFVRVRVTDTLEYDLVGEVLQ